MSDGGFGAGVNRFGLDLYRTLPPGNLVFSPASVSLALSLAWAGARGKTADEMRAVLGQKGSPAEVVAAGLALARQLQDPGRKAVFRLANRLFGEASYRIVPAFVEAQLELVSFRGAPEAARARINAWALEETRQRIRDLLPPGSIDAETRLVLANAMYFLGDWARPFERTRTGEAPFYAAGGAERRVPTMRQIGEGFAHAAGDRFQALKLAYQDADVAMTILLPNERTGLIRLEDWLTAERLERLDRDFVPKLVDISLPKFEIDPAASLAIRERLVALGMKLPFDQGCADFRGIADPPNPDDRLVISNVFHKAFVKTDEKGTEAAAATAAVMMIFGSAPPRDP